MWIFYKAQKLVWPSFSSFHLIHHITHFVPVLKDDNKWCVKENRGLKGKVLISGKEQFLGTVKFPVHYVGSEVMPCIPVHACMQHI